MQRRDGGGWTMAAFNSCSAAAKSLFFSAIPARSCGRGQRSTASSCVGDVVGFVHAAADGAWCFDVEFAEIGESFGVAGIELDGGFEFFAGLFGQRKCAQK